MESPELRDPKAEMSSREASKSLTKLMHECAKHANKYSQSGKKGSANLVRVLIS